MARGKKGVSLVSEIKQQAQRSGANKGKIVYLKPGVKVRVRFLVDMDEGMKVPFHDSFALGINTPCQEIFDRSCRHCDNEDLRTRDQYAWPVYDYDSNEVKILMGAANNCSPIPSLVAMYEAYGTLLDRDYVITKNGTGTQSTVTVVAMDKAQFRNQKAKPLSEEKMLTIIDKAFPDEKFGGDDDDDDEEDARPAKKKPSSKGKSRRDEDDDYEDDDDGDEEEDEKPVKKSKAKRKPEPEEDDEEEDEEDDPTDYDDMSAKELYALCKKRKIKVEPKKSEEYYITKLEKWDAAQEDDDEEDEW